MTEIEATISRISSYEGVERILIIKSNYKEDSSNASFVRSLSKGNSNDQGEKLTNLELEFLKLEKKQDQLYGN
jgi:hypothetical protein